jgi:hypothetical protein
MTPMLEDRAADLIAARLKLVQRKAEEDRADRALNAADDRSRAAAQARLEANRIYRAAVEAFDAAAAEEAS